MATFYVLTLDIKGTNGISHVEATPKIKEDTRRMRRDGLIVFTAAGYLVLFSVPDGGEHDKERNPGVGLATTESTLEGIDKG